MKKDVGMTTAQKSKETRRMEMGSIFVLYIQPTIPTYTSGYSAVMYVYVGIVDWIYRTKIDPISILLDKSTPNSTNYDIFYSLILESIDDKGDTMEHSTRLIQLVEAIFSIIRMRIYLISNYSKL